MLFFSCSKKILVGGSEYDSTEQALNAQIKKIELILSKISKLDTPIAESCVAFVPSTMLIETQLIELKGEPDRSFIEFYKKFVDNEIRIYVQAIRKRGLFNRLIVLEIDRFELVSFAEDFALFQKRTELEQIQWLLKKKDVSDPKLLKNIPQGLPPIVKINQFLKNIEEAIKSF
jgi:hypothetical protein